MKAKIEVTESIFGALSSHSIEVRAVEWPELLAFQYSLAYLERETQMVQPTIELESIIKKCSIIRRVLRASPVPPSSIHEQFLSLFIIDTQQIMQSHLAQGLAHLLIVAKELESSVNPFTEIAVDIISKDPGVLSGSGKFVPDVCLVVHSDAILAVNSWLDGEDLSASVETARRLQKQGARGCAVLFGSPELHTYSHNVDYASKTSSWLVTVPVAKKLFVLLGPGSRDYKSQNYELWSGMRFTDSDFKISNVLPRFEIDIVPTWIPATPKIKSNVLVNDTMSAIDAFPVLLPGDKWIFFAKENNIGPSPLVVYRGQENEISVKTVGLKEVQVGTVVVVRSEKSSRDFLYETAESWIDKRHGAGTANVDFHFLEQFRTGVQRLSLDPDALGNLTASGLEALYARYRLRTSWDDSSIAPQKLPVFKIFAKLIEMNEIAAAWESLARIRVAMRQAGHLALKELIDQLKNSDEWQVTVEAGGLASLAVENIGQLSIGAVRALPNEAQAMPITMLGKLIDADGTMIEDEDL
jgi:hypothetical protein